MLHFSHKDFTAMKKPCIVREFVTLLAKVGKRIQKGRLNASKDQKMLHIYKQKHGQLR